MSSYIYKIFCVKNKHFYVGRTVNFEKRKNDHLRELRTNTHKNQRLQNCYNKYGEESLIFDVITVVDKDQQVAVEQMYINAYIDHDRCMNINRSADTFCDVPMTEERKRKISLARIGRKQRSRSNAFKEAHSKMFMGHVLSKETKLKISNSHKGKHLSEEHKEKLRKAFSGRNNPMFGRIGSKNSQSKPVMQVDIETLNIIKIFECASEAARSFGCDRSTIAVACRGKTRQIKGYFWCYVDNYEASKSTFETNREYLREKKYILHGAAKPNARAVIQKTLTGEIVREFEFVSQVAKLCFDPSSVVKVCNGKLKTHKGFKWEYK
ncbi:MAG: hypothetical protein H6Q72_4352 [Firmicutes bacterium]|nr:hypothetical protein [Bacillota bacterium]